MDAKIHEIWNVRFVNRIIDSMADGVFTMDAKGRISSWNLSMERIQRLYSQRSARQDMPAASILALFWPRMPGKH